MEYFRRVLGALQETLDYVSSFTTYLLGDETHPGAEESGRTRELKHCSSRHNSEVETATHSGDVSPQGYLATFERPLSTEVTPFNQEIHIASEAVVTGAQATEAIPEPLKSACKCEGQEAAGQKLSESPQFLADAPKPRSTATVIGNDWQRDLEGLAPIQELQPWEPERAILRKGIQQERLEEIGLDTGSRPSWELAGNREEEQNGGRGTDRTLQRELEGTDQETVWTLSVVEQPSELKGAAWSEHGRLKELAKMAESQHLEEEKEEEEEESAAEQDQQRGTYEGTQQAVLERADFEGNQEGVLEGVDIYQQKPGKTLMTFEVQEWDPKWVAEEGNSHQSLLERTKDTEDHQQRELEGPLRNVSQAEDKRQEEQTDGVWEGTSERLVEEDLEVLEKAETRGVQLRESECTENCLQEEGTGSRAFLDMYLFGGEQMVGEPEKLTEELEAETVGHQQQEPERTERSLQQQPTGSWTSPDMCLYADGEQIVGEPEKSENAVEVVMLEDENSGHLPWEPEGIERRLHEELMGSIASLDTCFFGGEQIVGEPEKLAEEQVVVEVVLDEAETGGHQPWEVEVTENNLHEEPKGSRASLDTCFFRGEQIVGEPEKLAEEQVVVEVVLDEAETGGHQPWEVEVTENNLHEEPKGSRASLDTCFFGGEQIVGEPEKLAEVVLDEAETGGHQPWEVEVIENNLHEEPKGSRASLDACFFGGEQIVGEPEKLAEEQVVVEVVLDEAETGGHQPWEVEVTENNLHEEPKGSRASLDASIFNGEQTVQEPEKTTEEIAVIMQEEAETGGPQPWEPEEGLYEEPKGCNASLNMCLISGEQVAGESEKLTEEQAAVVIVLEEAEMGGAQPLEPEGPERILHEEPTESQASPDECLFAGPSTFPDEMLSLDTSAQKDRVMLRRKSSIRRAPSLKKPRLPTESQPPLANLTESVPAPSQAPRQPNPRHSGFGPMHPNMMAELQMRLRRPQ